jgi:hypothetical protein
MKAILQATRPAGMSVGERKQRDRILLLAVLIGWLLLLIEVTVVAFIGSLISPDAELTVQFWATVLGVLSLVFVPPALLAPLPFLMLYRRVRTRRTRILMVATGSVGGPFLLALMLEFCALDFNWERILGLSALALLPAFGAFLTISLWESSRRDRNGGAGTAVPVAESPSPTERPLTSSEIEFSYS